VEDHIKNFGGGRKEQAQLTIDPSALHWAPLVDSEKQKYR